MNESRKTLVFAGAAVVLAILTLVTAPRHVTPDAFFDKGEEFFPEFTDPNVARTLEVIQFDETTARSVPFKVTFEGGRWTIPSHHGYPADGQDRLAQVAAGLIGITKDDFRTDNAVDYAACGVIDPIDDSNPSMQGRGTRVTIRGDNDAVLADIIIGKSFEGRDGFHLVRVPDQKRVYGTKLNLELSTSFKDWIESDLMMIGKDEIEKITLKDYSVEERTGQLNERDTVTLTRDGDEWVMVQAPSEKQLDKVEVSNLVKAIDELAIEGVRPKPDGLTATLSKAANERSITQSDMLSLQSSGYYFTRDGRLVSNEGEVQVKTADGVTYTLRFGEVVFGTGEAVSAGREANATGSSELGENRFLMITTSFDASLFPEPAKPSDADFTAKPDSLWTDNDRANKALQDGWERWQATINSGMERSDELNARFARWYYVISSGNFDKLHLTRKDLLSDLPSSG